MGAWPGPGRRIAGLRRPGEPTIVSILQKSRGLEPVVGCLWESTTPVVQALGGSIVLTNPAVESTVIASRGGWFCNAPPYLNLPDRGNRSDKGSHGALVPRGQASSGAHCCGGRSRPWASTPNPSSTRPRQVGPGPAVPKKMLSEPVRPLRRSSGLPLAPVEAPRSLGYSSPMAWRSMRRAGTMLPTTPTTRAALG